MNDARCVESPGSRCWLLRDASRVRWLQSAECDLFTEFRREVLSWAGKDFTPTVGFWLDNGWLQPARHTKAEAARRRRWARTKEAELNSPWRAARGKEEQRRQRAQETERRQQKQRRLRQQEALQWNQSRQLPEPAATPWSPPALEEECEEDPEDAYVAFLNRPAGSFGVDSESYYSFVGRGVRSVDDVLGGWA